MEEQNFLMLFEIIAFATAVFLGIHYLSSSQKNNFFLGLTRKINTIIGTYSFLKFIRKTVIYLAKVLFS